MNQHRPSVDLESLAAHHAIRALLTAYCRAMDRMDRDLAESIWNPDATCNYLDVFTGTATAFLDWVWAVHADMLRHSHQITSVTIEIDVDEGCAASEAYTTNVLWTGDEDRPTEMTSRGRYLDRWSVHEGSWGIDRRVYVRDLLTVSPIPPAPLSRVSAAARRDRADPSYQLFRTFRSG
jgi:hypothetical protein